jgi:predicted protein tyrosine phosphatase
MKLVFICNQGQNRSKTAEEIFKDKHETKSAGLYNNLVTEEQLTWADTIIVFEEHQRSEIAKRFPKQYLQKRILCWEISDTYYYRQRELVEVLKEKFLKIC